MAAQTRASVDGYTGWLPEIRVDAFDKTIVAAALLGLVLGILLDWTWFRTPMFLGVVLFLLVLVARAVLSERREERNRRRGR